MFRSELCELSAYVFPYEIRTCPAAAAAAARLKSMSIWPVALEGLPRRRVLSFLECKSHKQINIVMWPIKMPASVWSECYD